MSHSFRRQQVVKYSIVNQYGYEYLYVYLIIHGFKVISIITVFSIYETIITYFPSYILGHIINL